VKCGERTRLFESQVGSSNVLSRAELIQSVPWLDEPLLDRSRHGGVSRPLDAAAGWLERNLPPA
jgi:hypothetical protein